MRKLCLINPPTTREDQLYFPMAVVTLATHLRSHGFPLVEIVDFDLELRRDSSLADWPRFKKYAGARLEATQAEIFGISSICSNFPASLLLARQIRGLFPSAFILLGGPQPSSVPEDALRAFPEIDAIVIGEGEETLLDLARSDFQPEALRQVPGIAFRSGDEVIRTKPRELMGDLDDLPVPDYRLIPLEEYINLCPKLDLIEAGRGCPFLCSFCSTAVMWERTFRAKSPARILEEMRRLAGDYGLNTFPLTHDNFTTSRKYLAEFCEYFVRNNEEKFGWSVSARSDTLNPDRLRAMHDAGCTGLFFGVDTGSPGIQKVIHKNMRLEQFQEHLKIAVSLGMACTTSFVIGFPEETPEDLEATLKLGLWAKQAGAAIVQFHPLSPLAGTPIYEQNLPQLCFDASRMAGVDGQLFGESAEMVELISRYPRLFSSFFYAPTPELGSLSIPEVAFFYVELVNRMPAALQQILEATRWSPLELFVRWVHWMLARHRGKKIDGDFVIHTVPEFLQAARESPEPFLANPEVHVAGV